MQPPVGNGRPQQPGFARPTLATGSGFVTFRTTQDRQPLREEALQNALEQAGQLVARSSAKGDQDVLADIRTQLEASASQSIDQHVGPQLDELLSAELRRKDGASERRVRNLIGLSALVCVVLWGVLSWIADIGNGPG